MIGTLNFSDLLTPIFSVLGIIVAGLLWSAWCKVAAWLHIKTTAAQEQVITDLAKQAAALAEAQAEASAKGSDKMNHALSFANTELSNLGIDVSPDKITAAIEKAVAELPPAK